MPAIQLVNYLLTPLQLLLIIPLLRLRRDAWSGAPPSPVTLESGAGAALAGRHPRDPRSSRRRSRTPRSAWLRARAARWPSSLYRAARTAVLTSPAAGSSMTSRSPCACWSATWFRTSSSAGAFATLLCRAPARGRSARSGSSSKGWPASSGSSVESRWPSRPRRPTSSTTRCPRSSTRASWVRTSSTRAAIFCRGCRTPAPAENLDAAEARMLALHLPARPARRTASGSSSCGCGWGSLCAVDGR